MKNVSLAVFVPTYDGRRGHPTLIGWGHVAGIRQLPKGLGLNAYLRGQPAATLEVPVSSPDVLADLARTGFRTHTRPLLRDSLLLVARRPGG